jgi:hypothetical protein
MPIYAFYDVLQSFQETHRVVINLAGELNDEQLRWRPKGYPTSIGFHLWHLARESDNLKAEILSHFPQIGPDFGEGIEIWQRQAERLGVDETQAIHHALHELAVKLLPQYEADDGPLTPAQVRQIRKRIPQGGRRSVRSSLFETETA